MTNHHDDHNLDERVTLPAPDAQGVLLLLSGWRRAGKTSLLQKLRDVAQAAGLRTGGFLSVGRFDGAEKTGIDLMDAASGTVIPLATTSGEGPIRTGHYTFNPAALAAGDQFAEAGHDADVFFVDELGPLELERSEGWVDVIPLVRARRYGVALVVVRPELIDRARQQFDLRPDSPVIMIDVANRDAVLDRLAGWLKQRAAASPDR